MIKPLTTLIRPLMRGFRAWTVQSYTEANIKNGVQYYARRAWSNSAQTGSPFSSSGAVPAAGNTRYLYFETGSKGIIVKDRVFKHIGEEFQLTIYSTPTVTTFANETLVPISNFRSDGLAVPTTVVKAAEIPFADISDPGTPVDTPEIYLGSTSTGQAQQGSLSAERERILPANSTFMVGVQLISGASGRAEYFLTWYEGGTDLPLKSL